MTDIEKQKWEQFFRDRDDATRTWLIEHYLPLVSQVVRGFKGVRPQDKPDLEGAGMAGLVKAVDNWQPARMDWDKYARLTIRYHAIDQARAMSWIPKSLRMQAGRIDDAEEALAAELGRQPTTEELAARLETDHERLEQTISAVRGTDWHVASLDWRQETETPWAEAVADENAKTPEEEALFAERREMLRDLLSRLSERERYVVTERFLAGRSQTSIAGDLGVHESRVSQILDEAFARLRRLATQMPLRLPGEEVAA